MNELEIATLRLNESKNEANDCRVMLKLLDKKKRSLLGKTSAVNHASQIRQNEASLKVWEEDVALLTEIVSELESKA